jgi:transcriptional regulator with XRE-family HTH domain
MIMPEEETSVAPATHLTRLGRKLREARRLRQLTLQELAGKVGLTPSHISQIERGVTNPSVSALLSLAGALDLPMEYFFSHEVSMPSVAGAHAMLDRQRMTAGGGFGDPRAVGVVEALDQFKSTVTEPSPIVLPDERETIKIVGGIEWQRLTPTNEDAIEFLELRYPPGASSGELAYTHRGREYGRALEGTLLVELGFSKYTLKAGSTITFDCSLPHRFVNVGDEPFVGVWVILDRS